MQETETSTQGSGTRSRTTVTRLRRLPNQFTTALRALAFWLAVVLPTIYLPLLYLETVQSLFAVSVLLVVHIVTVFVGASYDPRA